MAMLQLGGHLANASVKITPRVFWSLTAQHLLSISSTTANTKPTVTSSIVKVFSDEAPGSGCFDKKDDQKRSGAPSEKFSSKRESTQRINDVFMNLTLSKQSETTTSALDREIEEKIQSAISCEELLDLSQHVNFDHDCAAAVLNKLYKWIAIGKIKMNDVEQDQRFLEINRMVGSPTSTGKLDAVSKLHALGDKLWKKRVDGQDHDHSSSAGVSRSATGSIDATMLSSSNQLLRRMRDKGSYRPPSSPRVPKFADHSIDATISVLTSLASAQKRSVSILQDVSSKIVASTTPLDLKQVGDILYSVALLNFYDKPLMEKMCTALLDLIPKNDRCAVIGSILTSISFLRYRNDELLDKISTWIVEHGQSVRPQEICSLLMTLASMGYTPQNFEDFYQSIILPLKETDMCQSSEWLDVVWALTILNKVTLQHFESVLNSDFVNRLTDLQQLSTSKSLKLLNINAAARLFVPNYKGPSIPEDSQLWNTPLTKTKEKAEISNAIVSALKMLLPSDSTYLNITPNTKLGFSLDAVLCVDNSCTPLPVDSKSNNNKEVFRIAVLGCCYAEFCREKQELIGPVKFHRSLLEKQGYKVLLIPYSEMNTKDKLVTRVKYLIDGIKSLVQSDLVKAMDRQK
ncbi:hypothetical protein QAD02_004045 [Eretmocerus hayati]|uniref:Uncharacterized protein n=1 Tax=Eretmocerus hayati TaxID=131215 RepID=A0ACC2NNL5_9HYME|nr:hypothetical protein QAD02_004045 [Eretmocerus hayati]